ncbi:MAG: 30S ribosomal protein S24e [Candidatus Thalassarchaeum sp.]|nr:30S ribosomal protein S24e [Euryarchaeota archaeon]|tara:strand:- start:348 stop:716 length:369 start_codon:yes stop_codon:yes gene_type:complete
MEVTERKENPLLGRVEIRFVWNHANSATPSLKDMRAAAAKAEPGAKEELVFVKEVSTRFGMPQTTGLALVYDSAESAELEPEYVKARHSSEQGVQKAAAEPKPSEEEATEEEAPGKESEGSE